MKIKTKITVESLASRIKQLRMANGMTQSGLARAIGVSKTTVANWETGEFPRGRNLEKLAIALGIHLADLMGETTDSVDELSEEVRLLVAFRELTKEHQLIAIKLLEALKMTDN